MKKIRKGYKNVARRIKTAARIKSRASKRNLRKNDLLRELAHYKRNYF